MMTIRMINNEGEDQELCRFHATYNEAEKALQDLVRKLLGNIEDDVCVNPRGLNDSYNIRRFKKGEQVEEVTVYLY